MAAANIDRRSALREANRLYAEAVKHKHVAVRERRRAKGAMQRFDAFKARLEAMGIEVIIESPTQPQRRHSESQNSIQAD